MKLKDVQPLPNRQDLLEQYSIIELLLDGGFALERSLPRFIKRRIGESNEEYYARLGRFSYTNIPGDVLKHLGQRLKYKLRDYTPNSVPGWQVWQQHEAEVLADISRALMVYGECYLLATPERPTLVNPRAVLRYQADGWLVTHETIETHTSPVSKPEKIEQVTIFYPDRLEVWQGKDSLEMVSQETLVRFPSKQYSVPSELWLMGLAYPKAKENLVLSCHLFDLATAVYFQRTYKRTATTPSSLPTAAQLSNNGLNDTPDTGLGHLLELEEFKFNEPTGGIIDKVSNYLSTVHQAVREILDVPNEVSVNQAAVSKELDTSEAKLSIEAYLRIAAEYLTSFYMSQSPDGRYPTVTIPYSTLAADVGKVVDSQES